MKSFYLFILPMFSLSASFMVRVETISKSYDYHCPWKSPTPQASFGSGCLIDNQYILTNAHVIADAAYIEVTLEGDVCSYPCRVVHRAHDSDMALLVVDDPSFYVSATPLAFGEFPQSGDEVTVLGYPMGGYELSHTKGIVSRTEFHSSAYSHLPLLLTQIDAAINPGNSGGPVLRKGKLIGIATQAYMRSQNLGYMIPLPVIKRCLRDIKAHGKYLGVPSMPFAWQPLSNQDLKRYLKLPVNQAGVLITHSHSDLFDPDDILIKIDGIPIASNGTFAFTPSLKLSLEQLIYGKIIDDPLNLTLLREGTERMISIKLDEPLLDSSLISPGILETSPHYFIHGGLVFQTVHENYLQAHESPPQHLLNYYLYGSEEKEEVVIINAILPHSCNAGYSNMSTEVIYSINETPVRNLLHLIELIEANQMPFLIIELETGNKLIFDRNRLIKNHQEILNQYGIHEDRSHDL